MRREEYQIAEASRLCRADAQDDIPTWLIFKTHPEEINTSEASWVLFYDGEGFFTKYSFLDCVCCNDVQWVVCSHNVNRRAQ